MCRMLFAGCMAFVLLLVFGSTSSAFVLQNPQLNANGVFGPTDAAVGPNSLLYVADGWNRAVQVFDGEGRFRSAFSAPESPNFFPHQLAVAARGTIYATQGGSGTIRAFSPDGALLFGTDGGGLITSATQIAVGTNDELVVLDGNIGAVHVLDAQGTWLRSFGQAAGGSTLAVGTPTAMTTDSQGRIFVAGSCYCVAVFDPSGNRLASYSLRADGMERGLVSALAVSGEHLYAGESISGVVGRYTLDGTFVDRAYGFPRVDGMGVGRLGEVYIAHQWARSVDRLMSQDFAPRHVGVTRFFDRPNYSWILDILDQTGIGRANSSAETTAETFIVPGQPGEIVELTLSYYPKGGALRPRFGVFDRGRVTADPIEQPLEFGIQALEARLVEITRPQDFPPLPAGTPLGTLRVPAGAEIGFYMFPDGPGSGPTERAIAFLREQLTRMSAGELYERLQTPRDVTAFPHFSISGVNHGRVDQFVTFLGEDFAVVAAEDRFIREVSDVDLMDMVFSINARLIPVPEPAGGVLAIISVVAFALVFANRPTGRNSARSASASAHC